jgi:tyrosyl-tRNA synthetase
MDLETRMDLIKRVGEEIITEQELRELLQAKEHPIAYDGFEPSGLAHIAFGVFRAINVQDMIDAGVHFKLWVADWFGWLNNKLGGDLDKIQMCGKYFVEVWKAAGIPMDGKKVSVLWSSDATSDTEYWKKVVLIAKNTTVQRATRCLSIMGRTAGDLKQTALLFYPMMQTADIFHLKADICQLGLDQRRANMLAREVGPKLGWWKPVVVSHHMLMGLEGQKAPDGLDENKAFDVEISSKMSKSKPSTAIFVHDSPDLIKEKLSKAFCPEKQVEGNPIMEYCKFIVFRKKDTMIFKRPAKFGGDLEVQSYEELEKIFREGKLHPMDLKNGTAESLDDIIRPIREHFEKDKKANELYEFVKKTQVTR